ncbi:MAG TPA: right-handed parallel beta-helix repeat-containing protein [Blastocatellia bacterium]|nr:right-handed parallel beta-helix repeat-containing protein [Blastocatellia bacterium]
MAQSTTLNLSHDLVALGIASQNLIPDQPALDARPLFQAAIAYIQSHPVQVLTLDKGAYYFLTPQNPSSYLRLVGLSNLTIDLAGSTIYFQTAFLQGFFLANCQGVTLTNFTCDFVNPPYTQVTLTSVDPNARTLTYSTVSGWVDPATFNNAILPSGMPPVLWAAIFRNGDVLPGTSRMQIAPQIANNVLPLAPATTPWSQAATLSTFQAGDTVVITERGGSPPVIVANSDSITISNGTIHCAGAIALFLTSTSNSTVEGVQVTPRPGFDLISSNADGIHFGISGPNNHILNCLVTRTMDDALAIDSLDIATVTAFDPMSPNQVTVQRNEFIHFPNGASINFVDPATGDELTGATIVSQIPPDSPTPPANGLVQLTLDQNLPATLASGFGMCFAGDIARGGGSSIEHNVVPETIFGRGIWIGGAAGVMVQGNKIGNTSNGGIVVYQSTKAFPGPPAHDIVIQDNKLNGSLGPMASGTGTQIATGAIIVDSTGLTGQFFTSTPNTNISIIGNRVLNSGRSGVWVGELNGGSIQNNRIKRWDRHPELPVFGVNAQVAAQLMQDFTHPLVIHNSENVSSR